MPHGLLAPMPGSHGKSLWGQKAETQQRPASGFRTGCPRSTGLSSEGRTREKAGQCPPLIPAERPFSSWLLSVFWELKWTCPSSSQVRHGAAQMGALTGKGILSEHIPCKLLECHMAALGPCGWMPSSRGEAHSGENSSRRRLLCSLSHFKANTWRRSSESMWPLSG